MINSLKDLHEYLISDSINYKSPGINIDYIGFCPEGHTDDKVYSNMNYLAKFFEVDLEEPS